MLQQRKATVKTRRKRLLSVAIVAGLSRSLPAHHSTPSFDLAVQDWKCLVSSSSAGRRVQLAERCTGNLPKLVQVGRGRQVEDRTTFPPEESPNAPGLRCICPSTSTALASDPGREWAVRRAVMRGARVRHCSAHQCSNAARTLRACERVHHDLVGMVAFQPCPSLPASQCRGRGSGAQELRVFVHSVYLYAVRSSAGCVHRSPAG